ncbi:alkaline phosphatase family protein [Candidatus Amarolinea dominans]|uniref:alkaline phosphatase family protein n=1 Tax=Candidatus Amarolinea dominans TaxID=3140696 RepID=UPI001D3F2AA6|nr:alkaline phosphatase family protein [Anaerolineae bacterium]MBK7203830.1 alkaline phosphatase family protein [Anaerolineae bacterium]
MPANRQTAARRIIFLFLDGVGLGSDDPAVNPLARAHLPTLSNLLAGAPLTASSGRVTTSDASLTPLDATLGVPGRPQSATGQATLLTGRNVPQLVGEHYGPRPHAPVRTIVQAGTLLSQVRDAGKRFIFVNAYPPGYFEVVNRGRRVLSVMPLAAVSAGQALLTHEDLLAGRGFSADFTNEGWRTHLSFADAPLLTPEQAGRNLAALAQAFDFVLFEHWLTDVQGHRQEMDAAVANLEAFDGFLGGLIAASDLAQTLIVVTSDHGNVEDLGVRQHTMNAVPGLFIGADHAAVAAQMHDLTDLAPALRRALALTD